MNRKQAKILALEIVKAMISKEIGDCSGLSIPGGEGDKGLADYLGITFETSDKVREEMEQLGRDIDKRIARLRE